jgi:hypothetical protein
MADERIWMLRAGLPFESVLFTEPTGATGIPSFRNRNQRQRRRDHRRTRPHGWKGGAR